MTDLTDKLEMQALDALLVQARGVDIVPDARLLARIVVDAEGAIADWQPDRPQPQRWFAGILTGLGGWPAFGGLAVATVAGLWIGVAPPQGLSDVAGAWWGETVSVSLDPADDVFGLEG